MQFAVPQFTEVEDKLIGPLTLKQFFVLLAAGGLDLLFWSLPIPKFMAVIIDLPISITGIALSFASYNGRPMLTYIFPFITFMLSPRSMIFQREAMTKTIAQPEVKPVVQPQIQQPLMTESTENRLKKLAYLLDQKKLEEKELTKDSRN